MTAVIQSNARGHSRSCADRRAFHNFPVEIVRIIFEVAARSCATACALCLVSKNVKTWITPFLYRTVIIVDSRAKYHWNSFYRTMTRTRDGCSQTHSLVLKQSAIIPSFNFKDFSSIRNLVVHVLELPDVEASHPPKSPFLTHLTLNGIPYSGVFSLPLFRSITHLHLPHAIPHDGCQLTPTNLPNLTHLVCTLYNTSTSSLSALQRLHGLVFMLEKFTTLRVVAVYLIRHDGSPDIDVDTASLLDQVGRTVRSPFLIRPEKSFLLSDSEAWINGGESIWDKAERELYATPFDKPKQNAITSDPDPDVRVGSACSTFINILPVMYIPNLQCNFGRGMIMDFRAVMKTLVSRAKRGGYCHQRSSTSMLPPGDLAKADSDWIGVRSIVAAYSVRTLPSSSKISVVAY